MTQDSRILRPQPRGGGAASSPWIPLSYDDKNSETKPASFTAGTITMSGDVWQMRGLQMTTRHLGMEQGWRSFFTLPSGVFDGTGGRLEVAVECTSEPSDAAMVTCRVGLLHPGQLGIGCGIEFSKTTGLWRAEVGLRTTTPSQSSNVAGTMAVGCIEAPGDANGSNTVAASATCSINTSSNGGPAGDETTDSTNANTASMSLVVHFGQGEIATVGPGDSDWKVWYRVVPRDEPA